MTTFTSPLAFGQRVTIGGDISLIAIVIGFDFRPDGHKVGLSWIDSGKYTEEWVWSFRVKPA